MKKTTMYQIAELLENKFRQAIHKLNLETPEKVIIKLNNAELHKDININIKGISESECSVSCTSKFIPNIKIVIIEKEPIVKT